jgi:4-diphosphocytidyl-2-C-methyl-D-erythritol kinase
MEIQAPGKINLFLRVGGIRADGFHPVTTWMCTVGLFDTLVFERARHTGFDLTSDASDLPAGPGNLVCRAAEAHKRACADHRSASVGGLAVRLHKRIPVGAGMGGGSSDAARTLLALNRLWNVRLDGNALSALAGELGSDVPFFLGKSSALCSGRGEIIEAAAAPAPRCCVLILPPYSLSTREVYERFDALARDEGGRSKDEAILQVPGWARLPAAELMGRLFNDLEEAAFSIRPELGELREELERTLGWVVRMSGSGSTLFTLADGMEEGKALAGRAASASVRAVAVELGV